MKTISLAILIMSFVLQASTQNDTIRKFLHTPDMFDLKGLGELERLHAPYQDNKDALPENWHFKLPDSEKKLKQYTFQGSQYYSLNMPIDSLKFSPGTFNMPVWVPDSSVKYHMKIIGSPSFSGKIKEKRNP